jgi:hypothetical protein
MRKIVTLNLYNHIGIPASATFLIFCCFPKRHNLESSEYEIVPNNVMHFLSWNINSVWSVKLTQLEKLEFFIRQTRDWNILRNKFKFKIVLSKNCWNIKFSIS